jgi:hypothetical protein
MLATAVPMRGHTLDIPAWVEVKARALKGAGGFAVYPKGSSEPLTEPAGLPVNGKTEVLWIALRSLKGADLFVVRNGFSESRSVVEVEDLALWVRHEDFEKYEEQL